MGKPKRNDKADYNARHEKEIEADLLNIND